MADPGNVASGGQASDPKGFPRKVTNPVADLQGLVIQEHDGGDFLLPGFPRYRQLE